MNEFTMEQGDVDRLMGMPVTLVGEQGGLICTGILLHDEWCDEGGRYKVGEMRFAFEDVIELVPIEPPLLKIYA
jgi:hypothetical protein